MDKKELNNELRTQAINNGLCAMWQKEWKNDWDLDKMVSQFYRGIDFFLDKRFVSDAFIKDNFEKDFLRKNGILVDDTYSLLNPSKAILIGNSQSNIRYNNYKVSTIYIIDNSKAKIIAKGHSAVIVHLLGSPQVEVEQKEHGNVLIINHSKESVIISDDGIKIKEEFDYLK